MSVNFRLQFASMENAQLIMLTAGFCLHWLFRFSSFLSLLYSFAFFNFSDLWKVWRFSCIDGNWSN